MIFWQIEKPCLENMIYDQDTGQGYAGWCDRRNTLWMDERIKIKSTLIHSTLFRLLCNLWRDCEVHPDDAGERCVGHCPEVGGTVCQDGCLSRMSRARLNKEALHFRIHDKNIYELANMDINEPVWLAATGRSFLKTSNDCRRDFEEIRTRLKFLLDVGLDYLSLNRTSVSLSGGESQRIRLATQIGSQLVNVLYILDEPSIGLHQRDNLRLINSLKNCVTQATLSSWWSMTRIWCWRQTMWLIWDRRRPFGWRGSIPGTRNKCFRQKTLTLSI